MGQVKEGSWANTDPYDEDEDDEEPDGSDIFPPELFAPSGGRHKVDVEKKYVEWMGFSFFVGFGRDTGLRLFDIKFKGIHSPCYISQSPPFRLNFSLHFNSSRPFMFILLML